MKAQLKIDNLPSGPMSSIVLFAENSEERKNIKEAQDVKLCSILGLSLEKEVNMSLPLGVFKK